MSLEFYSEYWPARTEPARVRVELTVSPIEDADPDDDNWRYQAKVTLAADGQFRGVGGSVRASTRDLAVLRATNKLVDLLGEMLADALAARGEK